MLRLDWPTTDAGPGRRAYLFGVGLIGSRVGLAFSRRGWRGEEIAPWNDPEALSCQLAALARDVRDVQPARLDVIWSAGRAGFSSTAKETAPEERNFRRVLEFATEAARAFPGAAVFHVTNSAGSHFEGQRHADHWLVPVKLLIRCAESLREGKPELPTLPPSWLNRSFHALTCFEQDTLTRLRPPFGSSIFAVATTEGRAAATAGRSYAT